MTDIDSLQLSNPRWLDPEHTKVLLDCVFEGNPATYAAIPTDPVEHGRQILANALAGDYGVIADYVAPIAPTFTKEELISYANKKVEFILSTPRNYTVGTATIFNDASPSPTGVYLNSLYSRLSSITYPFSWQDNNGSIVSITNQSELSDFIVQVFNYSDSVWRLNNTVALPGIVSGSITTPAQIDTLDWPF